MSKEDVIEAEGEVVEVLGNTNFKVKIIFPGVGNALVEFQNFSGRQIAVLAALKVFHSVGNTLFLVFIKRFAACKYTQSSCGERENNFFVHNKKSSCKTY